MMNHPRFGIWKVEDIDRDGTSTFHAENVRLKCGFVCKECQQSVLAYKQPKKCKEHEKEA